MKLEEKQVSSKCLHDGKVIKVFFDEIELPDGKRSYREYIKHSGGAAVLFVKDNKVLLEKQYRYPYHEVIYEIPAGKLNPGEDPSIAANRELIEETGYSAKTLRLICKAYPTPGYTNENLYIYEAQDCEYKNQALDEGEFLNLEFVDLEQARKMIENGQINDAKTIIAIFDYLLRHK